MKMEEELSDPKIAECRAVLEKYKQSQQDRRKNELERKSYALVKKHFVFLRELFALVGVGGAYW
jgi:hypothetical protein